MRIPNAYAPPRIRRRQLTGKAWLEHSIPPGLPDGISGNFGRGRVPLIVQSPTSGSPLAVPLVGNPTPSREPAVLATAVPQVRGTFHASSSATHRRLAAVAGTTCNVDRSAVAMRIRVLHRQPCRRTTSEFEGPRRSRVTPAARRHGAGGEALTACLPLLRGAGTGTLPHVRANDRCDRREEHDHRSNGAGPPPARARDGPGLLGGGCQP